MPHSDSPTVEELFEQAIKRSSPDERRAFLDGACANDAQIRDRVDALLRAHDRAGNFLDDPAMTTPATLREPLAEGPGSIIDKYKLLQLIGEGGFGVVYMAEQEKPVRRKVALKIIKLGMDTKQVIARFEAERQALAMMDHPNIARVLDAGATEAGRPYFVMEYIKGIPILEYCDKEKLDTTARLDLFIRVCQAIQHAHQKGIIHRDIKPTNVLITLHDGRPVPKVIDFGIAKATNAELTEKTLFTQHRQMIGTPAYMSPEQAEMSGLDIDTRSDVYSLGVLLYELLTGTTPFANDELMSKGYAEMMRIIREVEPHKPSTRLSTLGETASRTAQLRHVADPRRLGVMLRGELDWIVMKCLEKDRTRRYETANGLAADIRRHLSDEPVVAGPPGAAYRMRKFVRRHRVAVIAGGLVAAVLVLGVIGTGWGLIEARRERDRAVDAQIRATRELARSNAIVALIDDMFSSADPHRKKGADFTVRQLLDEFDHTIGGQFEDQPLVEASIRHTVGNAYLHLGLTDDAERHLRRALDLRTRELSPDDPAVIHSRHRLALVAHDRSEFKKAERLVRRLLDETKGRADLASLRRELVLLRVGLLRHQGKFGEAETLFNESRKRWRRTLGEDHADLRRGLGVLADLRADQGDYEAAVELYRQLIEIERRELGESHPRTLNAMHQLARQYMKLARYSEAIEVFRETLELEKDVLGEEHPDTLKSMDGLARAYVRTGRFELAESLRLQSLAIRKRVLGEEHPDTTRLMNDLGLMYKNAGAFDRALPLLRKGLEIARRHTGDENRHTLGRITNLGLLYYDMGRYDDARKMFETSLPIKRRVLGENDPWTWMAMRGLARTYDALDRPDDALSLHREYVELLLAASDAPDADPYVLNKCAYALLTHEVESLRDPARALKLAQRACAAAKAAGSEDLWNYLDTLALAQHMTGETAAAVETQRRAIELMPEGADPAMAERLADYEAALIDEEQELAGKGGDQ